MKKLLIFFLLLASFFAKGQGTNVFKYLELKNVDTVGLTRVGQFWYNPTAGKFTFHDASGYKHFGTATGSFWPLTGSATLTGTVNVNGAQTVNIGTGTSLTAFNVTTTGGYLQLGAASAGLVAFGSSVTATSSLINIIGPSGAGVHQFKLGELSTGPTVSGAKISVGAGSYGFTVTSAGVFKFMPFTPPNIGQVITATDTDGSWTWQTPSGGGGGNPFDDGTAIIKGSADATKLLRFEVDGFTTGTTRVLTPPNFNGIIATTNNAQTITGVQTFSSLPTIPITPVAATDAASKDYVDAQALGPFSTVAPGYTNLSGAANTFVKGDNTFVAPATFAETLAGTDDTKPITPLKNAYVNPRVYNVKAYGAVGNGRLVTDGSITTGTAILTSTVGGFLSTDVGKYIKVGGAGAAGVDLITTILTYTSSTQVTLNTNASTTVSGVAEVIWGNDDTSSIQSAITAAHTAGGGVVYFPIGIYIIAGALQTSVGGQNPNSQLYIPATSSTLSSRTYIELRGEVQPNTTYATGSGGTIPMTGSILWSTITGSGTRPRLIGMVPVAGSFTYTNAKFIDLCLRTRTVTSNATVSPTMTAYGMLNAGAFSAENCVASISCNMYTSTLPATSTAIGFEFPAVNNSNDANTLRNCLATGYYKGFELTDHATLLSCSPWGNLWGYAFQYSPQPVRIFGGHSFNNKYDLVWESASSVSTVYAHGVSLESGGDASRWFYTTNNFYAPSPATLAYGQIDYSCGQIGTFSTGNQSQWGNLSFRWNQQSPRQLAVGGLVSPHYGGKYLTWDGTLTSGGILEVGNTVSGAQSLITISATQTGTTAIVASIYAVNNSSSNGSDARIGQVSFSTNGATNAGIVDFYLMSSSNVYTNAFSIAYDQIRSKVQHQLRAGGTGNGTAPLLWQSGSLMTTPAAGAAEFLTDKWYGTITTGTARKEFTLNDAALTSGTVPVATTNGRLTDSQLTFTTGFLMGQANLGASWVPTFKITPGTHTAMTASTEFPDVTVESATHTWATGALTTQRAVYLKVPTIAFNGASTVTNAYGLWVEPYTAGTNATITSNWAAGFNGSVKIVGGASINGVTSTGDVIVSTAGNGFQVKEGSNAKMGTATANGTTEVTVSTTAVTATSRIFIFCESGCTGVSGSYYISARTAGTSFGFKAAATDTGTVAWILFEPAP